MGRVMGCGLCPYNAIEKVGNYENVASHSACFDKKKCCSGKFHWFVTGLKAVPGGLIQRGRGTRHLFS